MGGDHRHVLGEPGVPMTRIGVVGCVHDGLTAVRAETIATGGVAEELGRGSGAEPGSGGGEGAHSLER
jgi:hypothetical protein